MILSTMIAVGVATQSAPTPETKSAPAPAAEMKMACCEMMAKGKDCCCSKDMATESQGKQGGIQQGDDAEGHRH